MATKNMFEKLNMNVKDDEENIPSQKQEVLQKEAPKKKKVRPQQSKNDDNEGFVEFTKKTKKEKFQDKYMNEKDEIKRPTGNTNQSSAKIGRGEVTFRGKKVSDSGHVNRGKREFDRHSGTGRGKEIAKGGSGNSYVVGNEKTDIKNIELENENFDDLYQVDLSKRIEKSPIETKEEAPLQEKENEEKKPKKIELTEEEKKEILEIPENAMSYEEYKNMMRTNKNTEIKSEIKLVEREDKENVITTSDPFQKKKNKPKDKKEADNHVNVELNIGSEDVQYDSYKKPYKKNPKKAKASTGFKADMDDFPNL